MNLYGYIPTLANMYIIVRRYVGMCYPRRFICIELLIIE